MTSDGVGTATPRKVRYCRECDGENIRKEALTYVCDDCGEGYWGVSVRFEDTEAAR